jgi:hypothetical protein
MLVGNNNLMEILHALVNVTLPLVLPGGPVFTVRTGDIVLLDSLFDNQYEHFRRSLSSASVDGVCATLNHACTVLEQDFREVLHSRVRAGFIQ